ncbi:hypothetical protein CL629_03915 [bacterium]|nr:hypothetical protein [bacterium]|tara:strand:+ start:11917 stop:12321 length:405 start_codon:yes stop_codon:yes gene_type:complete
MKRKIFSTPGLLIIAFLVIVGLLVGQRFLPGKLDAFAQCLKDEDVTYYGAYWCPNCQNQNQMFGNSKKHLEYVECGVRGAQNQQAAECNEADIEAYPTWEFSDGERVTGVQDVRFLAEKTGCELPEKYTQSENL